MKELYKSPPYAEHRLVWLLTGVCIATTSSLLLILLKKANYALFVVPAIIGLSLAYAGRTRKNAKRAGRTGAVACAVINLAVFFVFIFLFR